MSFFFAEEVYSSGQNFYSLSKEKFFLVSGIWIAIMEGDPIEKSYNHIAFKVQKGDLAFFEKKLKSLNLTILSSRARKNEEGESLYFYDYDNHLFELHTGDLKTRLELYKAENER